MTSYIYDMVDTWNAGATTFTAVKMNVTDTASASGSLLMDLQVGGSSRFKVDKTGAITATLASGTNAFSTNGRINADNGVIGGYDAALNGNLLLGNAVGIRWANSTSWAGTIDTFLTRRGTANLRLGAADTGAVTSTVTITIAAPGVVTWTSHGFSTGTPVVFTTTGALPTGITAGTTYYAVVVDANTFQIASSVANAIAATPTVITTSGTQSGTHTGTRYNITQRLSMQGITGVADRLGADLIIQGSQGTGDKAGGSIVFQVAPAVSSGTAQNALVTALTINSSQQVVAVDGSASAPSFAFAGSTNTGIYQSGSELSFTVGGTAVARFRANDLVIARASAALLLGPSGDVTLIRDAANTLALRNGANAQTFRVYNTTDGTNSEFLESVWSGNTAYIQTNKAGTGNLRKLYLAAIGIRLDPTPASGGSVEIMAANISTDTTTGMKIGTATTQKLGFYNKTPVVQPTAVADATDAATAITQLNALLSRMRDLGLIAT